MKKHVLPVFALLVASAPVFSQTALERANELCAAIQPTAQENGRNFEVMGPGACRVNINTGYDLLVGCLNRELHLSLGFNGGLRKGDMSTLPLHLSAFDNLAYAALGTKPKSVFDGLYKLVQKTSKDGFLDGKVDRASLGIKVDENAAVVIFDVGADVRDIDKMSHLSQSKTEGHVPTWRRILGLSLQVLGAGAQGYADAYRGTSAPQGQSQPMQSAPKTCYTNFIGATAYTNCY